MGSLIEFKDISAELSGKRVLDSLSFSAGSAEFLSIIGPNGAGKTSLLKLILGGIAPSGGQIIFAGKSLSSLKAAERAALIGYVPQSVGPLPAVGLFEFLKMSFLSSSEFRAVGSEHDDRIYDVLNQLKIMDLTDRPVSELSGGERQRALIAASIVHEPKLIILDEPTNSLDPRMREEILTALAEIKSASSSAVFLVTHDLDAVSLLSDRVLALRAGVKFFEGKYSSSMSLSLFDPLYPHKSLRAA